MKKLVLFLVLFVSFNAVYAYEYDVVVKDALTDGQKAGYNMAKNEWARSLKPGDVIFTKRMTRGSGGYTEMEFRGDWLETCSTYEFFDVDKLIGYNGHTLKFYELYFNGREILRNELPAREVQKYFPDVEIVKVSDFVNNKIELTKPWLQKKTFMIVNDTDRDFYKYQFEKYKNYEIIRGVFEAKRPQTFVFSHFGSRAKEFPVLEIKVKNSFK